MHNTKLISKGQAGSFRMKNGALLAQQAHTQRSLRWIATAPDMRPAGSRHSLSILESASHYVLLLTLVECTDLCQLLHSKQRNGISMRSTMHQPKPHWLASRAAQRSHSRHPFRSVSSSVLLNHMTQCGLRQWGSPNTCSCRGTGGSALLGQIASCTADVQHWHACNTEN